MRLPNGTRPYRTRLCKQTSSNEKGFTLIETVVALVILMIASLGIASLFLFSTRYNTGANERAVAIALAQEQMEAIRGADFEDITTVKFPTIPATSSQPYQITTTITNNDILTASAGIEQKQIRVRVTPTVGARWSAGWLELTTLRSSLKIGPNREDNAP